MLEKLDQVNIKDLCFEQPVEDKGKPFHPIEITSEDILDIRRYLYWMAMPPPEGESDFDFMLNTSDYFYTAVSLYKLGLGSLVNPTKLQVDRAFKSLNTARKEKKSYDSFFLGQLLQIKLAIPERVDEIGLDDELWNGITEGIKKECRPFGGYTLGALEDAAISRFLFPDREGEIDTDLIWDQLSFHKKPIGNNSNHLLRHLADAKIIFPERFKEITLTRDFWSSSRVNLDYCKVEDRRSYCAIVASLAIIAAEEFKITDQGIELTFPPVNFKEKPIELPLRRNF